MTPLEDAGVDEELDASQDCREMKISKMKWALNAVYTAVTGATNLQRKYWITALGELHSPPLITVAHYHPLWSLEPEETMLGTLLSSMLWTLT